MVGWHIRALPYQISSTSVIRVNFLVSCCPLNSNGNVYSTRKNLHFHWNLIGKQPTWKLTLFPPECGGRATYIATQPRCHTNHKDTLITVSHGDIVPESISTLPQKGRLSKSPLKSSKLATNFFTAALPHRCLLPLSSYRKGVMNISCSLNTSG